MRKKAENPLYKSAKDHGVLDYVIKFANVEELTKEEFPEMTAMEYLDYLHHKAHMNDLRAASLLSCIYTGAIKYAENSIVPIMSEDDFCLLECCYIEV